MRQCLVFPNSHLTQLKISDLPGFLLSESRPHMHTHVNACIPQHKPTPGLSTEVRDTSVLEFNLPYQVPNRNGVMCWARVTTLLHFHSVALILVTCLSRAVYLKGAVQSSDC